jgi:hypothetical protein
MIETYWEGKKGFWRKYFVEDFKQPLDKLEDELEFKWGETCNDPSYHAP